MGKFNFVYKMFTVAISADIFTFLVSTKKY